MDLIATENRDVLLVLVLITYIFVLAIIITLSTWLVRRSMKEKQIRNRTGNHAHLPRRKRRERSN
jgi:cytochrome oxidase assembly protein ShyY1